MLGEIEGTTLGTDVVPFLTPGKGFCPPFGLMLGNWVMGDSLGKTVGFVVRGWFVGLSVGISVGRDEVGYFVGEMVGDVVGKMVGVSVVGLKDGVFVGYRHKWSWQTKLWSPQILAPEKKTKTWSNFFGSDVDRKIDCLP